MNSESDLVEEIDKAFVDVAHPGNGNLLRSDGIDDYDVEFLYKYTGESWMEIDEDILDREYACLSALSDEGIRFVLPRYLKKILNGQVDRVGEWSASLVDVIANRGRGSLVLSEAQRKVSLAVIKILLKQKEGDRSTYQDLVRIGEHIFRDAESSQ